MVSEMCESGGKIMEYTGLRTLLVFFCCLAIMVLIVACSNAYENCVEGQKAEYRASNPRASYGQIIDQQRNFDLMCSRYKTTK